jgi:hypothetical protein
VVTDAGCKSGWDAKEIRTCSDGPGGKAGHADGVVGVLPAGQVAGAHPGCTRGRKGE